MNSKAATVGAVLGLALTLSACGGRAATVDPQDIKNAVAVCVDSGGEPTINRTSTAVRCHYDFEEDN